MTRRRRNDIITTCFAAVLLFSQVTAVGQQNDPEWPKIIWGLPKQNLQVGVDFVSKRFGIGEPIVLTVYLRAAKLGSTPVEVMSSTQLDPFIFKVFYGPKHLPIAMTALGESKVDPSRSLGTRGSEYGVVPTLTTMPTPLSDDWDLSRPGRYRVLIGLNPKRFRHPEQGGAARAPEVSFVVTGGN